MLALPEPSAPSDVVDARAAPSCRDPGRRASLERDMNDTDRDQRLERAARRAAEEESCELVDLDVRRRGGRLLLELTIDRASGVGVEQCAGVSRRLGPLLEDDDPIGEAYVLEVSSPGLTRRLRRREEYQRFRGRLAIVQLRRPLDGQHRLRGRLAGVADDGRVALQIDGTEGEIHLSWDDIAWTRLDFDGSGSEGAR